jgi:chemosensory pili system protein ChpA (sensor histidine kinase/response regulator)
MMDEQDVAGMYIAEMHALIPVTQRHLDTLGGAASEEQYRIAVEELARLGTAIADLSAGFHADDCAQVALVLAGCFSGYYTPLLRSAALLANCADLLTYLQERLRSMAEHRRVLLPTDAERLTASRLIFTLRQTYEELFSAGLASVPALPIEAAVTYAPESLASSGISDVSDVFDVSDSSGPANFSALAETEVYQDAVSPWVNMASDLANSGDPANSTDIASMLDTLDVSGLTRDDQFAISSPPLDSDEIAARLTKEERELLRTFQTSDLRPSAQMADSADRIPAFPDGSEETDSFAASAPPDGTKVEGTQEAPTEAAASSMPPMPPMPPLSPLPATPYHVTAEELDYIPPEMKRLFVVETSEDVQGLRRMVLGFEQQPDERATLSEMGRLAHKIKGAAATLGFGALASLTLIFEDVIRALQSQTVPADATAIGTLTSLLALVEATLEAAASEQATDESVIARAEALRDGLLITASSNGNGNGIRQETPMPPAQRQVASSGVISGQLKPVVASGETESSAARSRASEMESLLRVEVHRLDELMTHVNALALNRASFMQLRDDIAQLQNELDQALSRLSAISLQVTDLNPHQLSSQMPTQLSTSRAGPLARLRGRGGQNSQAGEAQSHWDALEMERFSEFDQAVRQLTEVVADTTSTSKYLRSALTRLGQIGEEQAAIAHDIQRDVMQIRLVRLEDLMPRIHLEARRLAASLGKAISFTVRGQMTEIDRNISEALAEPLIQLVRNAVVHGIEPREERLEHGKLETGSVWIHAYYVGSEVVIEVGDDGRGINPYRLAASAVAMGFLDADAARKMAFSEALDMMFIPGITTFHEAQMVAGRGIGLDEVRTAIHRLKGTITVRSEPDKGSVFRIRVPISLSIVRALSVHVAGQTYAVPFSSVVQMVAVAPEDMLPSTPAASASSSNAKSMMGSGVKRLRVRLDTLTPASNQESEQQSAATAASPTSLETVSEPIEPVYEEIPVLSLADLLGFETSPPSSQLALVIEVGRQRAALLVDQVSDDQEVVIQTLPAHLRRRAIRGATVTPDGVVQLLLDLPELVQNSLNSLDQVQQLPAPRKKLPPQRKPSAAPRVLVVDDSVSIRGALELTLTRAGFEVQLARDGIEALELMLVSVPQVMVLDIEMPRLDGFELLSVMRDMPQFAGVRVIMLTSRAADKHREQALKLGAADYLIKPCPQETLIEAVRAQLPEYASIVRQP